MRAAWGGRLAAVLVGLASAAALAAAFPAVLRIPHKAPAGPALPPPALFSHRSHQSFGCYACHPSLFPQALVGFTHAEMRQDRILRALSRGPPRLRDTGRALRTVPRRCAVVAGHDS